MILRRNNNALLLLAAAAVAILAAAAATTAAAAAAAEPSDPSQPQQQQQQQQLAPDGDPPSAAAAAADPEPVQPQQLPGDSPFIELPPLPPVYLPLLSTQFIIPLSPNTMRSGTGSPVTPSPDASVNLTPDNCTGAGCRGFVVINSAQTDVNSSAANSAVLIPAKNITIDPMGGLYEIATLRLLNGGLVIPGSAAFIAVPIRMKVILGVPKDGSGELRSPSIINLRCNLMWSRGAPSPGNQAGLFSLVTRNLRASASFNLTMTQFTTFKMSIQLEGFTADSTSPTGRFVEVLGDWGQSKPTAGQPGPRVFVKPGHSQLVKLMARICNAQSVHPACRQPPTG